ncbi:MAG TPA: LysR family transcriptional regulator [Kiloniellales bacterium]|nr:LysR family transcriptional regulator [Kiloniellales bacterium]
MTPRLSLRVDFDNGDRLGPGKIALLEAIKKTGSISAAGRSFGMAYSRAWQLVDAMNRMFAEPVIDAQGGGRHGGGALLTPFGERLVRLYRSAEAKVGKSAAKELQALEAALAKPGGKARKR